MSMVPKYCPECDQLHREIVQLRARLLIGEKIASILLRQRYKFGVPLEKLKPLARELLGVSEPTDSSKES